MSEPPIPEPPAEKGRLEKQILALKEIGLVLESTMSLEEVLTLAVERTTHLMGAQRSTLFLMDEAKELVSRVIDGEGVAEIRLPVGRGIAGWVARHGRALMVPDAYRDERFDASWDSASGFRTKCVLCHPIRGHNGRVIGVVEVMNKEGGGVFDEADQVLLGLLSGQLAMTIENSRLMLDLVSKNRALIETKQGLERRNQELDLLLDLERLVARSEDLDTLAVSIIKRTLKLTHGTVGMLYRVDDTGAEARVVFENSDEAQVMRVEPGLGLAGWVAVKGRDLNLSSPELDPRFSEHIEARIGVRLINTAAVPLVSSKDGPPQGALLVGNRSFGNVFDESDMAWMRLVANRLGAAVEHLADRERRERERRLATVGRLLAGVLHDLKSPISVASGYAELLAERAGGEEAAEDLAQIKKALGRVTTMAADIVAFARGERRILASRVLVGDLMSEFERQVAPLINAAGVRMAVKLRTTGSVRVDIEKLLRVFYNIVRNAVEAMEHQGGTKLLVEVDQLGGETLFSFTDDGPGVPEKIQGELFDSFVTAGKNQGTGLGLAVAKEIVEAHGGQIEFETVEGQGTTFLVRIPN